MNEKYKNILFNKKDRFELSISFLRKFILAKILNKLYNIKGSKCGYNLVVECHASDLIAWVRFPLPAPRYKTL